MQALKQDRWSTVSNTSVLRCTSFRNWQLLHSATLSVFLIVAEVSTGQVISSSPSPLDRIEFEQQARNELAVQRTRHPSAHADVATALNNLAVVLRDQDKPAEAEQLFREALAIQRKLHGPDHLEVSDSLDDVAQMLERQGKFADAEVLRRESVAMLKRMSGVRWSVLVDDMRGLAKVLYDQGKFADAESTSREMLTILRARSDGGEDIARCLDGLAKILERGGKGKEIESLRRESLSIRRKREEHPQVATALNDLAVALRDQGNTSYDLVGQLKTAFGRESGGVTNRMNEQMAYGYDAAGNLNFRTNSAFIQTFSANNRNQLTNVTRSGTLTVAGNTTTRATDVTVNNLPATRYADNTWARTNLPLVNATTNFTAIASNPYGWTETNTLSVNLSNSITLVYDLNGNLRTNGATIYEWDDENQLVTNWVPGGWKAEFVYDAERRIRISREYSWQINAWVKTNELHFVCDGMNALQERDTNNQPAVSYILAGSTLLARIAHSTLNSQLSTAFYHLDGNLNVTALINTNQLVVAQYLYDPYGTMLAMRGPLAEANVYRFSSKRFIASAGIYCFGYRFYDPNLQRWLNPDPIGEQGGLNLYGYGLNNPISLTDPLGLDPSLAALFFQNLAQNGLSDARRVNDRLMNLIGDAAAGAVKTAYKAVTDPGGLAYDIYEGTANFGAMLGRLSADPCARKRAWEDFKNHMLTPEGIADATFFVESILAGGLLAPEAGASGTLTEAGAKLLPQFSKSSVDEMIAAAAQRGIRLTEHGAERLLGREAEVSLRMIEKTLQKGTKYLDPKNNSVLYVLEKGMASGKDIAVVLDPTNGALRTVMTNAKVVRPRFQPIP